LQEISHFYGNLQFLLFAIGIKNACKLQKEMIKEGKLVFVQPDDVHFDYNSAINKEG